MPITRWTSLREALGLLALVTIGHVAAAQGADPCSSPVGQFVSLQGTIEIAHEPAEPAPAWGAAGLSQSLCVGALVRVGDRSRAEIALVNHSKVRIDQNTTVRLTRIVDEGGSLLALLRGTVYFFSRQPRVLEIDTPFVTAGIEGTEFLVRVEEDRSFLTVFEGKVSWSNDHGRMMVGDGESAVAESGAAPASYLVVRPRDEVQWALYYPPILLPLLTLTGADVSRMPAALRQAIEAAQRGDIAAALRDLDVVADADRDAAYHLYRAAILLMVGRVDEALPEIDKALTTEPEMGLAYALSAVIAVAQDDRQRGIEAARRAVELDPVQAPPLIALSYAEQSMGHIEAARDALKQAVAAEPDNALAWARLSEVQMMLGDRRRASKAAKRAHELAPDVARVQTVLGFSALALFDADQAKEAFEQAIAIDSADPQPRLGLGLAMIRRGDLAAGRREIEIAVALDPARALLRSYLGKAYFEEKRDTLAGDQFGLAKRLDPNDPTPWLYDAIRKQTENRPVEALQDLQTSIALNDNRAVYRSQTLLDQDRAARGASLARIYNDLGFQQIGLNEASAALALDPANSAAHRFLSDVYAAQPRLEIARASELLQSQLLQEVNINPIQPSLLENDFDIITRGGPARPGYNEYTSLFDRNRVQLDATGVLGNDWTRGGEAIVSGLYDWLSVSAGQFASSTDGFRRNFDSSSEVTDVFAQAAVTPEFNIQGEFRRRTTSSGDLRLNFDPNDYNASLKREIDQDTGRVGARYSFGPSSDVLASVIYARRNARIKEPDVPLFEDVTLSSDQRNRQSALQGEAQHIFRGQTFNVVSGVSAYNVQQNDRNVFSFAEPEFETITERSAEDFSIDQRTAYAFANVRYPDDLTWILGLDGTDFEELQTDYWSFNPKFGLEWDPWPFARFRLAAFRTVKPTLVVSQTLQPTQVAGFNQFFDDINGTQATSLGAGLDLRPLQSVYLGAEVVRRSLNIPISSDGEWIGGDEDRYRSYLYWTPDLQWAVSSEVRFDRFSANEAPFPASVDTLSVPVALTYFSPSGLFAGVGTTFVHQAIKQRDALGDELPNRQNQFFLLNAQIGYRLPLRLGLVSFQCNNMLNQHFNYLDESFRESGSQNPKVSPYLPERTFFATVTLQY